MSPHGGPRDGDWVGSPRPFLEHQPTPAAGPLRSERAQSGGSDPGTVRPYLLTGGRTAGRPDVNIETIVTVTGAALTSPLDDEHLKLLHLAREPMAVAELAAYMDVPIGVAMILAGDLAEVGVVSLNDASSDGQAPPAEDKMLIRKVLDGVLKLRSAETI
jgi:3',5'-cyclic AMP phosphodiesterase CpdA